MNTKAKHTPSFQPKRYLGLELAGAKNEKTAVAALEFYPREKKIFLLDIFDKAVAHDDQSGDEALLEIIDELKPGVAAMGVNVPLTLPPCITCHRKACSLPLGCSQPAVKWMHDFSRKIAKNQKEKKSKIKPFTPYTQRPVELWIRHQILPELSESSRFDIDEALGGTKAPLTARMVYLKRHLNDFKLIEAWPKLTVALLAQENEISRRTISSYRHLEEGIHARTEIIESLADHLGIFIYERDLRKLSRSLAAFDAFMCAYTALLSDSGDCESAPAGFPEESGWVEYPSRA